MKRLSGILLLFISGYLVGCSSTNDDPFESYNRTMYGINKTVDKYTLKPIAKGYRAITPDPVEQGVNNFFGNLGDVLTLTNNLLQFDFHEAAHDGARVVWNTTLGIGGIFDVASGMGLEKQKEDFGLTLRKWGVPAGPYLVLPFLGPSTSTDAVGKIGDYYAHPVTYIDWNDYRTTAAVTALGVINLRANLLDAENVADGASTDEYSFVKSSYLQYRAAQVRGGTVDQQVDDDFDKIFQENDGLDTEENDSGVSN